MVVMVSPEGDARVALVDVGPATDAAAAQEKAWRAYRRDAPPPLQRTVAGAARAGWDEVVSVVYDTPPGDAMLRHAVAHRKAGRWTVLLIDAQSAAAEKRGAAVRLMMQTLRTHDFTEESFAGRQAHRLDSGRIAALTGFVQTAMAELHVPGASLALIDQGKVVFEGGFGVREVGKPDPVDAHTRFMIGSNTKALTTLLLAKMVDAGKLGWDDKVTKVYPDFRLGSAETTDKVLVRHLVCACTGLPRKDVTWILNTPLGTPASASFRELATTEPTTGFGEVFQYNNLMASAAGFIAGHAAYPKLEIGAAFDRAMQTYVFDPLEMRESTFDYTRARARDSASPHAYDRAGNAAIAPADAGFNNSIIPYRPGGALWSSAHDMIRYVGVELSAGALPSGGRLMAAEHLLERRKPIVSIGANHDYGMGLMIDRQWGVPIVHHGGSTAGFKAEFAVLPDAGVGAVLLTNSDYGQYMLRQFLRRLVEVVYDGQPLAEQELKVAAATARNGFLAEQARLTVPADPVEAAKLADHYVSPDLGALHVTRDADGLRFAFASFTSRMASRRNSDGTFSFVVIDAGAEGFELLAGEREGRRVLTIRAGQHDYIFTEAAATAR
ncbi:class A beta-lactamase-related serine hydrolase [Sphingobium algorifonticola]|uniref:Class A beta-lactamase-related serine hydrolase n=1 Tax=Sphingobium algorifonticola TaxID=2008318 RepID=A0A437J6D5_9SPHN|nr:class A beta-lactamase-related serine hydrolase [Sphingobium algorifonticola]